MQDVVTAATQDEVVRQKLKVLLLNSTQDESDACRDPRQNKSTKASIILDPDLPCLSRRITRIFGG